MRKLATVLILGLIAAGDAHAYLDPGTGSAILQGILGGLAALAITLKLYWHRLLRFLGLRKPATGPDRNDDGTPDEPGAGDRPAARRPGN